MISRERVEAVLEGEEPDKVPISIVMPPQPIASLTMVRELDELKNIRWLPQYQLLEGAFSEREIPEKLENLLLFSVQGFFSDISYELGCDMIGVLPPMGKIKGKANLDGEITYFGINHRIKNGIFWRKETGEFPVKTAEDKDKITQFPGPTGGEYTRKMLRSMKEKYEDKFLLAMVQGPWETLESFMSMQNLLMSMVERPGDMRELLEYTAEIQLEAAKPVVEELDAVIIGDDYGTQQNLQISKEMWDEYVKPNLDKMVSGLKKEGYVCLHSCGHVEPLIPDLLEMGFDAINPIQEGANDLEKILNEYEDLVLLGGIDVQKTLPNKSPKEIKQRITSVLESAYPNIILADTNSVTNETPASSIRAVLEAHKEFNETLTD